MKHIAFCILLTGFISGCSNEQLPDNKTELDQSHGVLNDQLTNPVFTQSEFVFKGGIIELKEEQGRETAFTIQEVTKQKAAIYYRAKRIPTQLYLENQGLKGEELAVAMEEVGTEQLFYFEFEENQKQDLIKKYLEDDLDANISYLSFEIAKDFKLLTASGDTLAAAYSLYERNFHVAPYERLLLSFTGVDPTEEVQLLYADKLFGNGAFDFAFASAHYLENNTKNPS